MIWISEHVLIFREEEIIGKGPYGRTLWPWEENTEISTWKTDCKDGKRMEIVQNRIQQSLLDVLNLRVLKHDHHMPSRNRNSSTVSIYT
jgi:hypothetical protein